MEQKLPLNLSLYLDLIRSVAAFLVFTMHIRNFFFPDAYWGPFGCGREAVAAFFVISGFVISHVTAGKERDWRSYAVARMARIYPVAILSILLTLLCDGLAYRLYPVRAAEQMLKVGYGNAPNLLSSIIASLSFTNQIWHRVWMLGSNGPYWSLGFEVPYYLLFALYLWAPKKWRWVAMAGWALFYGPNICLYLPLWWLGVWTRGYVMSHPTGSFFKAIECQMLSWTILVAVLFLAPNVHTVMQVLLPPAQSLFNFAYYTSIGLAISLQIISFRWLAGERVIFPRALQSLIRWCASLSFSLYLLHLPVIFLAATLFPAQVATPLGGLTAAMCVLLLVYLLAQIGERQKHFYVRLLRPLFGLS